VFFNLGPRVLEMLRAPRYLNPALRILSANFSHWVALKFCTALPHIQNFVVITNNHKCVSPDVTPFFKLRRTLLHYMFGDVSKNVIYL